MDWFDDWALTLAVFLPAVGMAIVLLIPRAGRAADQDRHARHVARHARCRHRDPGRLRLRPEAGLAVQRQRAVDRRDPQPLPPRHRRDLAPAAGAVDVHHRGVRHLLVEPLPRAAQPEGVPRARPAARGRHERHVRRPGPHPLLHLLRDRAAPDVLHDRRVGRSEPRVRVDQVLPVHAVRLGDDAAVVPGAVLPVEGAHLRHGRALAAARRGHRPQHAGAAVRRALPRLRDQGADVPVPHVAARRAHRGADRRFGAAGRDPPEARCVRVHPHRAARSCPRPRRRGRRGSGCSR